MVLRKLPISVNAIMGRFPSLMGRFPTLMGHFPKFLNGPFSLLRIPGKQPIKKRGVKRFLTGHNASQACSFEDLEGWPKWLTGFRRDMRPMDLRTSLWAFSEWAVFQRTFTRENGPLRHSGTWPIKGGKGNRSIKANALFSGTPAMVENNPSKMTH